MTMIHGSRGTTTTEQGNPAYGRDPRRELFLAAVTSLVPVTKRAGRSASPSMYVTIDDTQMRIARLARQIAVRDPRWMIAFITWLRHGNAQRAITVMIAAQAVDARLHAGITPESENTGGDIVSVNRALINLACGRADDPGVMLRYWMDTFGKVPKAVKRGIGDALARILNERNTLMNIGRGDMPLANVIELTHPKPSAPWQGALFEFILNHEHGVKTTTPAVLDLLPTIKRWTEFADLRKLDPKAARDYLLADSRRIREAGLTWEDVAGLGPMDSDAWEAAVPSMGALALLRNLRNFTAAGVDSKTRDAVTKRLGDPDVVRGAGILPMRFWSAATAVKAVDMPAYSFNYSGRLQLGKVKSEWDPALNAGMAAATQQLPELDGKTLILVDMSGSMGQAVSPKSDTTWMEHAAVFGSALALKNPGSFLVQFGDSSKLVNGGKALTDVFTTVAKFSGMGGTQIHSAVTTWLIKHPNITRVVLITDEETGYYRKGNLASIVGDRWLYVFNVVGGGAGLIKEGAHPKHHTFGGLNDASAAMIQTIEAGAVAGEVWPFKF